MTNFIELIKDHDTGMYELYQTDGDTYDKPLIRDYPPNLIHVIGVGIRLATRRNLEFRIPARMISMEEGKQCTRTIIYNDTHGQFDGIHKL